MLQRSTLDQMSEARRAEFIAALPRGRLIEPEEIARLIVFLCTPAASVLHGAVLDASMGLGVRPGLMTEFGH
jgi:NAD(P)-dependent dehydrogenase (short-subunit alcohol dehydrogenase family)